MMTDKEAEALRKLVASIKFKLNDSSSSLQEKKLYKELLKRIRYTIKLSLLIDAYDSSEEFQALAPSIEQKMRVGELQKQMILDKYEFGEVKENEDVQKTIGFRFKYNKFAELKKLIDERSFTHYVEAMNEELGIDDNIISICSDTLGCGIDIYGRLFGDSKEVVDYKMIDFIISLSTDQKMLRELSEYFEVEDICLNREKNLDIDRKYLDYFRIINDNRELVKAYLVNIAYADADLDKKEKDLIFEIGQTKSSIDVSNKGLIGSLMNRNQVTDLEHKLDTLLKSLKKLREVKPKIGIMKSQIDAAGLTPIVEAYKYPDKYEGTVELMIANELKAKSLNFDYESIRERVEEDIRHDTVLLSGNAGLIKKSLAKLSDETHKYLKLDHDLIKKSVKIATSKKHNGILPLATCFVLKLLVDSKKIDAFDLNKIFNMYNEEEMYTMQYDQTQIVENTVESVRRDIEAIESLHVTELENYQISKK